MLVESDYQVVAVVTQPDKPKGRKRQLTPSPVKEFALERDLPVIQPKKIRTDYEEILQYEPDLIVTAAYGQILPKELLVYHLLDVLMSMLPCFLSYVEAHRFTTPSCKARRRQA